MTKTEWETFMDLLHKVVKLPGTWQEKKILVEEAADEYLSTPSDVDEFAGWFQD